MEMIMGLRTYTINAMTLEKICCNIKKRYDPYTTELKVVQCIGKKEMYARVDPTSAKLKEVAKCSQDFNLY